MTRPTGPNEPAICRRIRTLCNFQPPVRQLAGELEIRDTSLQFVRKFSGFNVPRNANEAALERVVAEVADSARWLTRSLSGPTLGEPVPT